MRKTPVKTTGDATRQGEDHKVASETGVNSIPEFGSAKAGLSEYLRRAWEDNKVNYSPPSYGRPYRTPMFVFVRRAKAHADLEAAEAFSAASIVEQCMRCWPERSAGDALWQTYFPESEDAKTEFIHTWEAIRWPRPELDRAQEQAALLPLKPLLSTSEKYDLFVSIAGHLQKGVDGAILLPCVKFSEILACEPMTVSRYRSVAVRNGLLKLVRKGIKAQRKADEFSFAVELFDWRTGKQISAENLNSCLASTPEMLNRESEIERKEEPQEKQEKQEQQEMQREPRTPPLPLKKKCSIRSGPYIPTTAELDLQLQAINKRG